MKEKLLDVIGTRPEHLVVDGFGATAQPYGLTGADWLRRAFGGATKFSYPE
jgi:hypothetical protein